MPFYAVRKGETPGIYKTWPECQKQITGFKGPQYKKFDDLADAEEFLGYDLAKKLKKEIAALKQESNNGDKSSSSSSKRKHADDDSDQDSSGSSSSNNSSKNSSPSSSTGAGEETKNKSKKKQKGSGKGGGDEQQDEERENKFHLLSDDLIIRAKNVDRAAVDLTTDADGSVVCYTDGACFMMGKKGQVAGVGVYFGPDNKFNIAEPVKDGKPHTNNRSKILSVAYAVEFLKAAGIKKAVIHVDSEFTLNCVDKWRPNWKKKDWKTAAGVDVKNKEELKLLDKVSTIEINYSMAADTNEPSGYSEATRLSKEGAKKTHD